MTAATRRNNVATRARLVFASVVIGVILIACSPIANPTLPPSTQTPSANPPPTRVDAQGTPVPDASHGAPVILNGQILWRITEARANETATERAARISRQLDEIATNPFLPTIDVTIADTDQGTEIAVNGQVLYTVTDRDALASGRGREELAQERAELMRTALADARQPYNPQSVWFGSAAGILTVAILFVLLWLVNRFYYRLRERVDTHLASGKGMGDREQEAIRQGTLPRRLALALLAFARVLAWFVLIVVLFPLALSFFPFTHPIYEQLREWVLAPLAVYWQNFLAYLPNLFFVGTVALIAWGLIRLLHAFFAEIKRGAIQLASFDPEWADMTYSLLAVLIVALAVVTAFPYLPASDSPAFQGITVLLGLLITLASSSAISNVIAGIILTYNGAFHLGDTVQIGNTLGIVIEKRLLTTRLRTFKNEDVSIPNSLTLGNSITNYSALAHSSGLILHTQVTIGYDSPWRQVHQLLTDAARATPEILADPAPFVLQTALNGYNVCYELNAYTRAANLLPRVMSALHENIQNEFNAAGVEIMAPAYTALRDGNQITLPKDARPIGYRAPGFRMNGEPTDHSKS